MKPAGQSKLLRSLLAINLVLIAVAAVVWWWAPQWIAASNGTGQTIAADPVKPRSKTPAGDDIDIAVPDLSQLTETRQRPVFSALRAMPAADNLVQPVVLNGDGSTLLDGFAISGVVVAGAQSIVLLRPRSGGKTLRLRVGDDLEGWSLQEIDKARIVFRNGDDRVTFPTRPE